MYRRAACLGLILAGLFAGPLARADERASPEEAKALAQKAAAHMKAVGPNKAIADFNNPGAGFIDRELFVVVYGPDHRIVSSYGVPLLNGKDATTLKDVEGRFFGKDIIEMATTNGSGWVDYRMTNALTKKVGLKSSWVERVGDYIVFVGAFKN